jgi:hypothetical protein
VAHCGFGLSVSCVSTRTAERGAGPSRSSAYRWPTIRRWRLLAVGDNVLRLDYPPDGATRRVILAGALVHKPGDKFAMLSVALRPGTDDSIVLKKIVGGCWRSRKVQ